MSRDTTVIAFRQPDNINDPLTELAREGARRMLAQVLVAEADAFVAMWKDLKLPDGRDRIVRHGHGPDRTIQTGVGPVEVRRAKVRDRHVGKEAKIRFSSSILPKWARRTRSLDALLPVLYLRGVSTGDFQEALTALLGIDAPNLSPAVISRLTAQWQADYDTWQKRDLSARRYVYVWADGVYLQARMEDNAECMLVLIGATPEGNAPVASGWSGCRVGLAPTGKRRLVTAHTRLGHRSPSPAGQQVVKSFRYLLTDPRQFDILQSGPCLGGDRMDRGGGAGIGRAGNNQDAVRNTVDMVVLADRLRLAAFLLCCPGELTRLLEGCAVSCAPWRPPSSHDGFARRLTSR